MRETESLGGSAQSTGGLGGFNIESLDQLTPEQIDKALDDYQVDLRLTEQTLVQLRNNLGRAAVSTQMSKYFQEIQDLEIMRRAALTVLEQVKRELNDVIAKMQKKIKELTPE